MKREERLNLLYSEFDKFAKEFFDTTNGNFFNIHSEFKGPEKPENLKHRFAEIYYNSFYIKFKYTAHTTLNVSNSILEVLIYLDKTQNAIPIPLPLFLDYCDITSAKPMIIPSILNGEGMKQAFDCLGGILKENISLISNICYNADKKNLIHQKNIDEMQYIFDVECNSDTPPEVFEGFLDYFTIRFTVDAFDYILKGNSEKALKKLKKAKKLTGYEKRIVQLLESEGLIDLSDLPLIISNAAINVGKSDFKEFSTIFISSFIMSIGLSVIYSAIYYLLMFIEGFNSVYLMGPIYGLPYCILCGFITSLALSYFTRFKFYKLFFKKSYERYRENDHIINGGGSDRLMKVFLWVIIILCLAFLLFISKWNINFTEDGFIDNSKFFSVTGDAYSYSDIEKIYYKPNRINGFGEELDLPSYAMKLKNGEEIDFYELEDIERYEKDLLDFFREKDVKIEK